mgnify:CR=1 FL=1
MPVADFVAEDDGGQFAQAAWVDRRSHRFHLRGQVTAVENRQEYGTANALDDIVALLEQVAAAKTRGNAVEVGADRLANAVGGHAMFGRALIIVDFGTATTFDVIDFNGAYKGGIIAPGINLSLDALVANTAKLPRIAIELPATNSVIGTNTEDQMLIGVFWGYVAMMEGLIARMRSEIGRPAKVIATGGLATLFDEASDIFDTVDSDLTLDGLAILAERALIK